MEPVFENPMAAAAVLESDHPVELPMRNMKFQFEFSIECSIFLVVSRRLRVVTLGAPMFNDEQFHFAVKRRSPKMGKFYVFNVGNPLKVNLKASNSLEACVVFEPRRLSL